MRRGIQTPHSHEMRPMPRQIQTAMTKAIQTTEIEAMQSAIAIVMSRAHPPIVMTLQDVANFLGYSYNFTRNELACKPDFPSRLERFSQPRYSRDAIMEWAQVH